MEAWISDFISNVAFPIAAFYMMYRMCDDTLRKNTEAINKLSEKITDVMSEDE